MEACLEHQVVRRMQMDDGGGRPTNRHLYICRGIEAEARFGVCKVAVFDVLVHVLYIEGLLIVARSFSVFLPSRTFEN